MQLFHWLIECVLFIVLFKNISLIKGHHHCRWRLLTFRFMLGAYVTPALKQDLGYIGYIPCTIFSGSLYFFLMIQSYRELVIITLHLAYRNMFSRFFTVNHFNWRSNQPWHIDIMFSQTVFVMEKTHIIDINTCIK